MGWVCSLLGTQLLSQKVASLEELGLGDGGGVRGGMFRDTQGVVEVENLELMEPARYAISPHTQWSKEDRNT